MGTAKLEVVRSAPSTGAGGKDFYGEKQSRKIIWSVIALVFDLFGKA